MDRNDVSILVVMDLSAQPWNPCGVALATPGFNPCCDGPFRSTRHDEPQSAVVRFVSILVVMDLSAQPTIAQGDGVEVVVFQSLL